MASPWNAKSAVYAVPNPEGKKGLTKTTAMTESQQQARNVTIQLFLNWRGIKVGAKDVDGNTALHCLAGARNVSEYIVKMVRQMDGGEETWQNAINCYVVTPR